MMKDRPDELEQPRVFPVLDSLRGLAAVCIVITHCAFLAGTYTTAGFLGTVTARLDVGVAIFFVLSGFLLSRPYLSALAEGRRLPPAGDYLWKRALRILPLYWIAVVAAMVLLDENDTSSVGDWVSALTMTTLYGTDPFPFGLAQMWSLAVEVSFYAVLPLLAWILARTLCRSSWSARDLLAWTTLLVYVSVLWLTIGYTWVPADLMFAHQWLPAYLSWFAGGIALGICTLPQADGRVVAWFRLLGRQPWACWACATALLAVAATPIAGPVTLDIPTAGEGVVRNLLYTAIATLVILPGVFASPSTLFARIWSLGWLRHLGQISYGIFCVHMTVLFLVFDWRDMELFRGRGLELFVLTLLLSVAVSEVLYRLVELPSMRLRHLFRRRPASSSAATSKPKEPTATS